MKKLLFFHLKNKISIIVSLFILFNFSTIAQIKYVEIGVNGLTCSACTRTVEMSIRKLDFVQDVQMNLKNTDGKILFKAGKTISIEKIAQAVVDAGFSVRYLKADISFDNLKVSNNYCYAFENSFFQFIGITNQNLSGEVVITFLGKKFLPRKEYKKWESKLKPACSDSTKNVYFVTL